MVAGSGEWGGGRSCLAIAWYKEMQRDGPFWGIYLMPCTMLGGLNVLVFIFINFLGDKAGHSGVN